MPQDGATYSGTLAPTPDSLGSASLLVAGAVRAWRFGHELPKLLGEMTLVGKPELGRHFGQRFTGEDQGAAAHAHAKLAEVIVRGNVVRGLKLPLEGPDGKPAGFREILVRDPVREILADKADRDAQR